MKNIKRIYLYSIIFLILTISISLYWLDDSAEVALFAATEDGTTETPTPTPSDGVVGTSDTPSDTTATPLPACGGNDLQCQNDCPDLEVDTDGDGIPDTTLIQECTIDDPETPENEGCNCGPCCECNNIGAESFLGERVIRNKKLLKSIG